MGMFDSVDRPPVKCKICGREINDFQTKCGFKRLFHLTPEQLIEDCERLWGDREAEYYGYCNYHCGAWYFTYVPDKAEWKEEFLTREDLYGE